MTSPSPGPDGEIHAELTDGFHLAPNWLFAVGWTVGCALVWAFNDGRHWPARYLALWACALVAGGAMIRLAWREDRMIARTHGLHLSYRLRASREGQRVRFTLRIPGRLWRPGMWLLLRLQAYGEDRQTSGTPQTLLREYVQRVSITAPAQPSMDSDPPDAVVHAGFLLDRDARSTGTLIDHETQAWRVLIEGLADDSVRDCVLKFDFPPPPTDPVGMDTTSSTGPITAPLRWWNDGSSETMPTSGAAASGAEARRQRGDLQITPLNPEALAALPPLPSDSLILLSDGERWQARFSIAGSTFGALMAFILAAGLVTEAHTSAWAGHALAAGLWWLGSVVCAGLGLHWATRRRRLLVDATGLTLDLSSALRRGRQSLGFPREWRHETRHEVGLKALHSLVVLPAKEVGPGEPVELAHFSGLRGVEALAGMLIRALVQRRGRFVSGPEAAERGDPQRWRLPALLVWMAFACYGALGIWLPAVCVARG